MWFTYISIRFIGIKSDKNENLCIKQSIFSGKCKLAVLKLLFKLESVKVGSNYRLISILYNFSKIFGKIVKNRLIAFLERN